MAIDISTENRSAMREEIDAGIENSVANDIGTSSQFVSLLTMHQSQLRAFIFPALGNHSDAMDVLQRTNLKLWEEADRYRQDAPFLPWALCIARFEILSYLRDRKRERVIFQTDVVVLMCMMGEDTTDELEHWPDRQQALNQCLKKLSPPTRQIIDLRYVENRSLKDIAQATSRSIDSIKSLMLRTRRSLRNCIQVRIAENG